LATLYSVYMQNIFQMCACWAVVLAPTRQYPGFARQQTNPAHTSGHLLRHSGHALSLCCLTQPPLYRGLLPTTLPADVTPGSGHIPHLFANICGYRPLIVTHGPPPTRHGHGCQCHLQWAVLLTSTRLPPAAGLLPLRTGLHPPLATLPLRLLVLLCSLLHWPPGLLLAWLLQQVLLLSLLGPGSGCCHRCAASWAAGSAQGCWRCLAHVRAWMRCRRQLLPALLGPAPPGSRAPQLPVAAQLPAAGCLSRRGLPVLQLPA